MTFPLKNLFVTVEHLTRDSNNSNKEGFVSDAGLNGTYANIQPVNAETAILYQGAVGKLYSMYTTASGILETDRVTISGSTTKFIVKGKQDFNYGPGQHVELVLEEIL